MNILEACTDPNLFGPWFRNKVTWNAWFVFLAALFGLPMDEAQQALFQAQTGRTQPSGQPQRESWLVVGRRGGKSFIMALVAVYLACFQEYRQFLQPGERATVAVIAADRKQARVIMRYVRGMLTGIPMLTRMVERETAEGFDLTNAVTIEVSSASFRATRGYTFAAILADEIAFWRTDEAAVNTDTEVLTALRPGLATIPTSMLVCASSPYARSGELWQAYRKYFGKDEAPLVWHATTRAMNPTVQQQIIDAELEKDPARAKAEYMAEFRTDIETFISQEAVQAVVIPGRYECAPRKSAFYTAFVDPSGGSGSDSFALAIAHYEGDSSVLDAVREWRPPYNPEIVVEEACAVLKQFNITAVTGDRYAGDWVSTAIRAKGGITYNASERTKSQLYLEFLPLVNSGRVELLDNQRLVAQLCQLERRASRGSGREFIDHPQGAHDDLCNAVAGALVATTKPSALEVWSKLV